MESAVPSRVWPGVSADFAVDGHGFEVEYVGRRREATVRSLRSGEHWERFALLRSQLVLLHAGSNDVSSGGGSPQQIAWELLVFDLVASGVGHVVISQLIWRENLRELSPVEGVARTVMVNEVITGFLLET